MAYKTVTVPADGQKITIQDGKLQVPDQPDHPLHRGRRHRPGYLARLACACSMRPCEKAYGGKRKIAWMEVFAGEKAFNQFGSWLPDETVAAFHEFLVGIKGPLTTPIGGGIRSLNVALRKALDLYVCLRPVRYFKGVPSPVKHPEYVDMVIFRENTEDIYTGIEFENGTRDQSHVQTACSKRVSPKNMPKSASPRPPASGSSRSRKKAPTAWCGPPSAGRWRTSARA